MKAILYVRAQDVDFNGRTVRAMIPDDRVSAELFAKVRPGRMVLLRSHTPRNGQQLKMIWALCQMVADNSDRFDDAEHVMDEIKMNTGHVKRRRLNIPGLGLVFQEQAASIAYESMKQDVFELWFQKALDYVASDIWPGMKTEKIRDEIAAFLGLEDGRATA